MPGVLDLGPTRAGIAICFEVAYDDLVRDTVRGGADLLVVQTNNATFGYTDEAVQQLAMSRLRAIEHGRSVAHVSTVGESALITPDGRVVARAGLFTPAVLEATLPLRTARTPADRLGGWAELGLAAIGLLGLRRAVPGLTSWAAARAARLGARRSHGPPGPGRGTDRARGGRVSESPSGSFRVLVVIPTYQERENVEPIVARVRAAVPDAHVLVADDNSPDGTGAIVDALAAGDDHVHVLHREGKQGLGRAYLAGFAWGMERGFDVLVEMDADGSHQPEQLPHLLTALEDADLVLGSRWVPGGRVENWPLHRKLISRAGTTLRPPGARRPDPGRHRRVPGVPDQHADRAGPGRRRVPGLLLPDRPGLAGRAARAAGRRGADHVRRARARREQDERRDRARVAGPGHAPGGWPTGPSR